MKRILLNGIIVFSSMFFIGCSSNYSAVNSSYYESLAASQEKSTQAGEHIWGDARITDETADWSDMPEYYEENAEEKYKDLTGKTAFPFNTLDSKESTDIEDFQIGTMLSDGTFIYGYTTKEKNSENIVHCAASYQYETESFKTIYRNSFARDSDKEDQESFYIQMCKKAGSTSQSLFIYENGKGFLYDLDGTLEFSVDIEGTVRSYFTKGYSMTVTNALTDGANGVYVDLTIEKTQIELDGDDVEDEEKEAEELEKTIEVVLCYDFTELLSDIKMNQINLNHEAQVKAWQNMTASGSYTSEPDASGDWATVCKTVPDKWGQVFFENMVLDTAAETWIKNAGYTAAKSGCMSVFQWNNNPLFNSSSDGYVCTFEPQKDTYKKFEELKANAKLNKIFIPLNGRYYEVYGTSGAYNYYEKEISRTYTYETTETNNGKTETVTSSKTQTLKVKTERYVKISNGYLEGYRTFWDGGIDNIIGAADNQILCQKGNELCWLKQDGTVVSAGITLSNNTNDSEDEAYLISLAEDGTTLYYLVSTDDCLMVLEQKNGTVSNTWVIEHDALAVEEMNLNEASSETAAAYATAFQQMSGDYTAWEQLTADKFQKTTIQADTSVLKQLQDEDVDTTDYEVSGDGFLLTNFGKGLLYYDLDQKKAVVLDSGTWYGTWKRGVGFVSVGFAKSASYSTLDVAYATVKEYQLNDLYKGALDNLLLKVKNEKAENESKTAETQSQKATMPGKENVEDMMTVWKKQTEETTLADIEEMVESAISGE